MMSEHSSEIQMNRPADYPLFTVIIPQKNRAEYLLHTLKTCAIQDYPNFEVIISDDCSEDNSIEIARKMMEKDSRIKLFSHKHHLGMRNNFEFALERVRPGFVMALGGDDGLVPESIQKMHEILSSSKKELLTWTPAGFSYPDSEGGKNIFFIKRKKNYGVRFIKSESFLNKVAETFHYQTDECPMLYMKGVASTSLIDKVKSRTKNHRFYSCPTPDGFSGIVLAGEVEDYAFTYEPLSITGTTKKSQGSNYRRADEKSRKEAFLFFNDNIKKTMHSELASQPYSPLETLMTADYLLTARDLPGWPGKFKQFTYDNLIRATFKHLEMSYFENDILKRELQILKEIARQHDLLDLFGQLMKATRKRNTPEKIYGFIITHSIRFEGSELGVNNIYDAALATKFIYKFYNKMSISFFLVFLKNMCKAFFSIINFKLGHLPKVD